MNSFADRDIFMRFLGGGISHFYMRELEREFPGFLPGVNFNTGEFDLAIPDDQLDAPTTGPSTSPTNTSTNATSDTEDTSHGLGDCNKGEDEDGDAEDNKGEGDERAEGEVDGDNESEGDECSEGEDSGDSKSDEGSSEDESDEDGKEDRDGGNCFETLEGGLGFGPL